MPKKPRLRRNLNEFELENDGNYRERFTNNSVVDDKDDIQVFFRDISKYIINEIEKADIVLGCVAWLTDPDILEALSKKEHVCVIVQKEDFLRPDLDIGPKHIRKWKNDLREKYRSLKCNLDRLIFDRTILHHVSTNTETTLDAIRCVGNYNRSRRPAFPRMHNKFLIFAKKQVISEMDERYNLQIIPYSVWTGSFNLTKTAKNSLENSLLIKDKKIVWAYFKEFNQICAMSEPLDWSLDWIAPEWRIGT